MTYWKNLKYNKQSTSATLVIRKFHNFIKLQVFKELALPNYQVLELAAGRGVDIHKHRILGAGYILYVDSSGLNILSTTVDRFIYMSGKFLPTSQSDWSVVLHFVIYILLLAFCHLCFFS